VEVVHCELGGVNYAEKVNVEDLDIGLGGIFVFV
jgi:hypothetical protein